MGFDQRDCWGFQRENLERYLYVGKGKDRKF